SSSAPASTSAATTTAPSSTNACVSARPMPLPAPVTTATLPVKSSTYAMVGSLADPRRTLRGCVRADAAKPRPRRSRREARSEGVIHIVTTRIDELLAQLSVDEKAAMVAGTDLWHTAAVDRLGIPPLKVTDGPIGARGERWTGGRSAAFPCGTALGATWDVGVVEEV